MNPKEEELEEMYITVSVERATLNILYLLKSRQHKKVLSDPRPRSSRYTRQFRLYEKNTSLNPWNLGRRTEISGADPFLAHFQPVSSTFACKNTLTILYKNSHN